MLLRVLTPFLQKHPYDLQREVSRLTPWGCRGLALSWAHQLVPFPRFVETVCVAIPRDAKRTAGADSTGMRVMPEI